jgi:hypothetical protein
MAAPVAQLRTQLSAPGLLKRIRQHFEQVPDHRCRAPGIPLADALMSGLAVFGLKYPALLQFDQAYRDEATLRHNLNSLYGVEHAPCDTQLRTVLDPLEPEALRGAFRAVHSALQRGKALEAYAYRDGHYVVSIDGTGQYASSAISCPECCVKTTAGQPSYYHQLLGAVIVHPALKTVLPLMPEAITRRDGASKNDCERNAAKRLLTGLRADFPQRKFIIVEDSLASNGPHIELLQSLDMRFILGVKPGDHEALFAAVAERIRCGAYDAHTVKDDRGVEHHYRWVNAVALNQSYPDLKVNYLEYRYTEKGQEHSWSWVTDLALTHEHVEAVMRAGRARWKVENETFNTLKNQGYQLEHNYGHGYQHLATVLAILMMLAFLVDQVQELSCRLFQAARARLHSRIALWEKLRALFTHFCIPDWGTLWRAIAQHSTTALGPALTLDTS